MTSIMYVPLFSSVSFNPYHKTTLASADYEGLVSVWDVNTCSRKASHHEHNKRVWSVVYNPTEPLLYASGSDDTTGEYYCETHHKGHPSKKVQFYPWGKAKISFPSSIGCHVTSTSLCVLLVKMWSANCQRSIFTLETKANVCSVQFHPLNRFYLAFGSAGTNSFKTCCLKPIIPSQIIPFTTWTCGSHKHLYIS